MDPISRFVSFGSGGTPYQVTNQGWISALGTSSGDYGREIDVYQSSNIYVCGKLNNQAFVAKYNSSGTIAWQKVIPSTSEARGISVDQSTEDIYVGCNSSYDLSVCKLNSSGTIQWHTKVNNNAFTSLAGLASISSNRYMVTGKTSINYGIAYHFTVNSSGGQEYKKTVGLGTGSGYTVQEILASSGKGDSDSIHCGRQYSNGGYHGMLYKHGVNGSLAWEKIQANCYFYDVQVLVENGYEKIYVVGMQPSTNTTTQGSIVGKFNQNGHCEWLRTFPGSHRFEGLYATGSSVFAVGTTIANGTNHIFIAEYDTSGTLQKQQRIGGTGGDFAYDCHVLNNKIYITGTTESLNAGGNGEFFLIQLPQNLSLTGSLPNGWECVNTTYSHTTQNKSISNENYSVANGTDTTSSVSGSSSTPSSTANFVQL